MAHYSEMDFLFSSKDNKKAITDQLNNTSRDNTFNVFKGNPNYVVYKSKKNGTGNIISYLGNSVYKNENVKNPYVKLLEDFKTTAGTPGAGLKLRAADIAYLRDLGVYPLNRMAILRRFPEGCFVPENLEEMTLEPISTVVGWIKPDQTFGSITFNENWTKTNKRFDILLNELVQRNFGLNISAAVPIPDFAQGVLFQFYNNMKLTGVNNEMSINEDIETFNGSTIKTSGGGDWGLLNIPVGDPNVLQEAPFRDPNGQNIVSNFQFELTSTYEQKLLGDVDPGSAMLDILDNIYAMGTSNMVFYWSDSSDVMIKARQSVEGKGNNINSWWLFITSFVTSFWDAITDLFNDIKVKVESVVQQATSAKNLKDVQNIVKSGEATIKTLLQTVLTSTVAIHRFELRGSMELMTGGKYSSAPWYLTLGNPYSPWISTNHIIVKSCSIDTSTEMGFNDQPQWLTAKFTCEFSRSLGKQELMRMFNNTYRRTYSTTGSENNTRSNNIEGIGGIGNKPFAGAQNNLMQSVAIKPVVSQSQKTPGIPNSAYDYTAEQKAAFMQNVNAEEARLEAQDAAEEALIRSRNGSTIR